MQEDLAQNQAPQSTMPIGTPRGLYATAIFSIATCGIYDVFWAFSHFKRLSIPGKGWPGQALCIFLIGRTSAQFHWVD